jgi:DNA-binding CsgD family transcriptional regulator/tetratricopeptide (TPR) repeat protein
MQAGRQRAAIEQCREALHIADRAGAASAKGRALNTLGVCLALTGRAAEGIAALREAASIADGSGRLEDVLRAYANLTYVLELTGRLREALGVAAEGIDRSRELGVELTGSGVLLANAASVLVLLGRWEEADRMLDSAGTREMDVYAPYLEIVRADADIARGRWETASSRLAQARSSGLRISEPQFAGSVMAAQAELELWRPDYPAAIEAISEGLRALEGTDEATLRLRLCALGLRAAADARRSLVPSRQRAEVATEHRLDAYGERLAATSDEVVAGLAGVLFPEMRALAALCRAELSRSRGRDTGAEWAAVAEGWTSLERPFPAAYAWWRRAEAAVGARESTAASCARTAHQLARRLGAVPLAAEVESLAARARIPLAEPAGAPADPDVDTGGGPAERLGLTSRERQVLAHLVLGHTNRQIARALFISEKTASVHVSNILGKLGVPNRGQAAAVAHRAGLVPPD